MLTFWALSSGPAGRLELKGVIWVDLETDNETSRLQHMSYTQGIMINCLFL